MSGRGRSRGRSPEPSRGGGRRSSRSPSGSYSRRGSSPARGRSPRGRRGSSRDKDGDRVRSRSRGRAKRSRRESRSSERSSAAPSPRRGSSGRSRSRSPRRRSPKNDRDRRREDKIRRALERVRRQAEKKKEKRDRKDARKRETPKERALRKANKEAKKAKSYFGYTNQDNPFGDPNLHEQFTWKRKEQKEVSEGRRKAPRSNKEREKERLKLLSEVEQVQARRRERELEKEERERLVAEEQRLKEQEMYGDWEKKEEEFHQKQAREASKIRIREGRERPIDVLAKNILLLKASEEGEDEADIDVQLQDPYAIFEGLPAQELIELEKDIRTYQRSEGDGAYAQFWVSLKLVCRDEREKAEAYEAGKSGRGTEYDRVEGDVLSMLRSKSETELTELVAGVEDTIERGKRDRSIDTAYWRSVAHHLDVHRAKLELRKIHAQLLIARLEHLQAKKMLAQEQRKAIEARRAEELKMSGGGDGRGEESDYDSEVDKALLPADYDPDAMLDMEGSMSPTLEESDGEDSIIDEEEDRKQLAEARAAVLGGGETMWPKSVSSAVDVSRPKATDTSAVSAQMYAAEMARGLEGDEVRFGDEAPTRSESYSWMDKYRPRKPRYFNRVKTGWEWNSYNKSHFDHDNPPPKVVQGYKFNIFYPDLIDKTATPKFFLEKASTSDMCILRIHAGPPYEDIAFKIVNREWEHSHKRGFKSEFSRGIFQLHFNFKRARYRR